VHSFRRNAERQQILVAQEVLALPQLEPRGARVVDDLLRIHALVHARPGPAAILLEIHDADRAARLQRLYHILE
jgi:hypothetical protein